MYQFTRDDFNLVSQHPLFLRGVELAITHCFSPTDIWFRGDPNLLHDLVSLSPNQYYSHLKHLSLPNRRW